MSDRDGFRQAAAKVLDRDEVEGVLSSTFYEAGPRQPRTEPKNPSEKPTHYKVICISMYTTDIERLEEKVAELKRRGYTKANKSQLIRMALSQIDLDKITLPQP